MRILGLDTTTNAVSCAVLHDGVLEAQIYLHTTKKHSETFLPALQSMLRDASLSMKDMDAFAVTAGPGSFTGVRIGVAAASAFSYVLSRPIYEVSTLDALIRMAPDGMNVCAILDARRDQVYVKAQSERGIVIEESASSIMDVMNDLRETGKWIFTGDGAIAHRDLILSFMDGASFMPEAASYPLAAGAAMCAAEGCARKTEHDSVRPVYLRAPQAERALKEKRKREEHANTSDYDTPGGAGGS